MPQETRKFPLRKKNETWDNAELLDGIEALFHSFHSFYVLCSAQLHPLHERYNLIFVNKMKLDYCVDRGEEAKKAAKVWVSTAQHTNEIKLRTLERVEEHERQKTTTKNEGWHDNFPIFLWMRQVVWWGCESREWSSLIALAGMGGKKVPFLSCIYFTHEHGYNEEINL